MMKIEKSNEVAGIGTIGIRLSLIHLIFVWIAFILMLRSFQPKFLLIKFMPLTLAAISLGVSAFFVLRLKKWAHIVYLISMLAVIVLTGWSCYFVIGFGGWAYGTSLPRILCNLGISAFFLLESLNIASLIALIIFFVRPKAKILRIIWWVLFGEAALFISYWIIRFIKLIFS